MHHAELFARIESLREEIKLIQNQERFYRTVKRDYSRRTQHTPVAKFDFLKCKLNSESCKDGRWCARTYSSALC
jgi:hypothetical protein